MTEKDKNIKKEKAKNLYKTQESRKTSRKNKSENLNMDQESWKNRERKNRKTFTWTKNQESYRESLLPFKINTGYRSQEKLARGIFLLTNHHIYSTFFTIFVLNQVVVEQIDLVCNVYISMKCDFLIIIITDQWNVYTVYLMNLE